MKKENEMGETETERGARDRDKERERKRDRPKRELSPAFRHTEGGFERTGGRALAGREKGREPERQAVTGARKGGFVPAVPGHTGARVI